MEIVELFKDSLTYPTKQWDKLLILGVLFLIMGVFAILQAFGIVLNQYIAADILGIISFILAVIITLIIYGYTLSIVRKTVNKGDDLPEFDWGRNFVDGVKVLILSIVYYIIPVIITLIVIYATGAFQHLYQLIAFYAVSGSLAAAPESLLSAAGASFLTVFIVAAILFIIFGLLFLAAKAVLADTESLGSAVNMVDVFKKIGEISWGNYILWAILYAIIIFILSFVVNLISAIPVIGLIIAFLIIRPYIEIFAARALGLVYNESKE
ncbi:hypothetical protein SDC9_03711 [bioreactor metagenome]|uniref:Glycerophosphoryl diester phosphodiesterase membrane domain-containing protein n=1 Tax=bioreactor metagenome TaxID=1076179 RepID=A0A644SU21_9ZZZZ|nr:DUF4013 domain-containing protein [Methanobrevibacter sp.]MEA4956321.1 DUF4013 domain-containing protein [Methanobrevibacter sp.]